MVSQNRVSGSSESWRMKAGESRATLLTKEGTSLDGLVGEKPDKHEGGSREESQLEALRQVPEVLSWTQPSSTRPGMLHRQGGMLLKL